jgi:hypothetical protein
MRLVPQQLFMRLVPQRHRNWLVPQRHRNWLVWVTNSTMTVRSPVIGRRSVVYVAVCTDYAGMRVYVAWVREIVPHGVVWTAPIVGVYVSCVLNEAAPRQEE